MWSRSIARPAIIEVKSGLTRPANLTEQQAVTQANVVRYIRNREGYDPYAIEEYFGIAALLSTGDAARELQALFSAANPQNPAKALWPSQARSRRNQVGDLPERQHRDRALFDHRKERHGIDRPSLDLGRSLPLHRYAHPQRMALREPAWLPGLLVSPGPGNGHARGGRMTARFLMTAIACGLRPVIGPRSTDAEEAARSIPGSPASPTRKTMSSRFLRPTASRR